MTAQVEALLRRQRMATLAALSLLVLLAWYWLWTGAGMGMAPRADLAIAPVPAVAPAPMAGMPGMTDTMPVESAPLLSRIPLVASMWVVMMVAMMLPAAAPVILLYAVVSRSSAPGKSPATGAFLAGYVAVWCAFAVAAAVIHLLLEQAGWLSAMAMAPTGKWLMVALLVAAGLYQLSPWKEACLAHCRSPADVLTRHLRPGAAGAFRAGTIHGAYCLGCCWMLMALLFVGGVMNLAWIALLTLLVAGEKLLPGGKWFARVAGAGFLLWAAIVALR